MGKRKANWFTRCMSKQLKKGKSFKASAKGCKRKGK